MAEFNLAVLLTAKDMASKTIGKVGKEVGTLGRISGHAQRGVKTLAGNLVKLGAVAGVGIGVAVKSGIESLATLESATTSVDAALRQMGIAGDTTAAQVAGWANEIESSVQAAFDDKDILEATENIIRYGKVSSDNLRPAMVVMTDLAAKTGDVKSASELLGKALADPTKAAGKLSRYGIILTKAEQDQIKAMTDAGDAAGAQALLLDVLSRTTSGAAAAMNGPYNDAMKTLGDVTEDAQRALAEGFLPVLMRVSDLLKTALADPKVMDGIKDFGESLAGGLDSLISIAQQLPWTQIGDSLRIAGTGARAVLDAFTKLPPWFKTAVISGWGLNKLTGGALGSIVGELGKGLIKGVLGMNAAVVNLKAGVVNSLGGGGLPGGAAAAGGTAAATTIGGLSLAAAGSTLAVGFAAAAGPLLALMAIESAASPESKRRVEVQGRARIANIVSGGSDPVSERLDRVNVRLLEIRNGFAVDTEDIRNGFDVSVGKLTGETMKGWAGGRTAWDNLKSATATGLSNAATAARATTTAINSKNWSPTINNSVGVTIPVTNTVSVRGVTTSQRTVTSYNPRITSHAT